MKGLYSKFHIEKADGTPIDPDAKYFILRIDNDLNAWLASMLWALSKFNFKLFLDLKRWRKP